MLFEMDVSTTCFILKLTEVAAMYCAGLQVFYSITDCYTCAYIDIHKCNCTSSENVESGRLLRVMEVILIKLPEVLI